MKKTLIAFAAAASLATLASVAVPTKADAQIFAYQGARYCFYVDGWHGPGWYRCGFRWRQGLGWGGVYGWHGWRHYGWERRHHRHFGGGNIRVRPGPRMGMEPRGRNFRSGEGPRRGGMGPAARGEMRSTTGAGGRQMQMRNAPSGGPSMNAAPGGGGGAPAGGAGGGGAPSGGAGPGGSSSGNR